MDKPIKLAIATEDGAQISAHLGRAPYYEVLTVEGDQIVARERRAKTFHAAGQAHDHHGSAGQTMHAGMISAAQDCVAIIAGGMGKPAFASIQAAGVQAVVTDERDIERAARAYAAGTLVNHLERLH